MEVVASDGTIAHFSSCGRWIAFLTADGKLLSEHDIDGSPGQWLTNRRGVAYVIDYDGRICGYRPGVGLTSTLDIPHIGSAECSEGVIYALVRHPSAGVLLVAVDEPT